MKQIVKEPTPIEAVDENNDDVWKRETQKNVEYYVDLIRRIDE